MNKSIEDIKNQINELEEELNELEFGSYSYDCVNVELEYLYLELDRNSNQ